MNMVIINVRMFVDCNGMETYANEVWGWGGCVGVCVCEKKR